MKSKSFSWPTQHSMCYLSLELFSIVSWHTLSCSPFSNPTRKSSSYLLQGLAHGLFFTQNTLLLALHMAGPLLPCGSFLNHSFSRDTFPDHPGWLILCILSFLTISISGIILLISWLFFLFLFRLSSGPSFSLEYKNL